MSGWIDEVDDGWVYGRYGPEGLTGFVMHILDVPECQRVDLQPGSYFTFVNGNYLLLHKTMWSSHALEQAAITAQRRYEALRWDRPTVGQGVKVRE
ncbi:hypothetical protein [Bradyrhizobium sp. LA2.1]|uniref:hypothetical protein n=1 Tax=Bradyrhizobium sp. LA2.1 TaxID=3156376 RepID=UPI0033955D7A